MARSKDVHIWTTLADALVAGPWRLTVLRTLFTADKYSRRGPARGALNHVRDALVRRGEEIVIVRIINGGYVAVNLGDYHHQRIAGTGRYEQATTSVLQRSLGAGDVFLDVGSNAGFYSALAAGLGARVYAFEPNPAMADLIQQVAHPNVEVTRVAVGDEAGDIALNLSPDPSHSGISSIHDLPHLAGSRRITVPVITLDEFCTQHALLPRVVKIDVEGHEGAVIDGMSNLLQNRVPESLIVELRRYPGFPDPAPVADKIMGYGYHGFAIREDGCLTALTQDALDANDNVYFRRR
jgi:FkbM family methyltransferase